MSQRCPSRAVFDIETQRVGNPYEIEASAVTVIVTDDGIIRYWDQDHIRDSVEFLLANVGLVTFNGRAFDIPVLQKYMSRGEAQLLKNKPHFDIFHEFQQKNPGQRISLDNMARTSLGFGKFELVNNTAPGLWRIEPEKLKAYNAWDTHLTYLLYIFCVEKGYLEFTLPVRRKLVPENLGRTSS